MTLALSLEESRNARFSKRKATTAPMYRLRMQRFPPLQLLVFPPNRVGLHAGPFCRVATVGELPVCCPNFSPSSGQSASECSVDKAIDPSHSESPSTSTSYPAPGASTRHNNLGHDDPCCLSLSLNDPCCFSLNDYGLCSR